MLGLKACDAPARLMISISNIKVHCALFFFFFCSCVGKHRELVLQLSHCEQCCQRQGYTGVSVLLTEIPLDIFLGEINLDQMLAVLFGFGRTCILRLFYFTLEVGSFLHIFIFYNDSNSNMDNM